MQAISEFDQNDAHIARHGQQHLAKVFRLRILAGFEVDFFQLAQAIHKFGNGLTEFFRNLLGGYFSVFDDIMQQGCDDGLRIKVQGREDASHGDGCVT